MAAREIPNEHVRDTFISPNILQNKRVDYLHILAWIYCFFFFFHANKQLHNI